ncbi:hypothetical protein DPH97_09825 [Salmonella enterica]|nr:hypothetical protein [Salmonella enterica]
MSTNRQFPGQPHMGSTMSLTKCGKVETKGFIMPYSGLVAHRLIFIDIKGATVVNDPLSSQEFAR